MNEYWAVTDPGSSTHNANLTIHGRTYHDIGSFPPLSNTQVCFLSVSIHDADFISQSLTRMAEVSQLQVHLYQ